ncbi:MAG: sulfatase-like hydrolase/transferase, partial [Bacteroidota bacterium]|nr:sulfatase-like hydrolase/transferase [Bacteroidota bacterium]
MRTPRRTFALLFVAVATIVPLRSITAQDQRPNIIYVMADDMGCADLSSFGRTDFTTPNIDAFVRSGMKFNNAYAGAPVCTPTRVSFMTGKYPARNPIGLREPLTGSPDDVALGLSPTVPTVSSVLKQNGYETALFGKWHLGLGQASFPLKHGFDEFFGILSGAADYFDHRQVDRNPTTLFKRAVVPLYENNERVTTTGYLTDLITEHTTAFIKRKHEKPFFVSVQYTSPHWPWQSPVGGPAPDSMLYNETVDPAIYKEMILNLDKNFGEILKAVREAGLEESTMIIFTSDNGGDRLSNMGPYQGGKLQLWEGGIRVPAAIRWTNKIAAGIQTDQPIITMDWTATILAAASCKQIEALHLDGINLLEYFQHPDRIVPRKFFWRTSNRGRQEAYRSGDWKYLSTGNGEFLFNLA